MQTQNFWGWLLAIYLFLAGAGAGAYVVGVISDYLKPNGTIIPDYAIIIGPISVAVGTAFLLLDLGHPVSFMRAPLNPRTSWISRGTIIISTFMILGFIHIGVTIWPFTWLAKAQSLRFIFEGVTLILAGLTMLYTGLLLRASRTIAIWRSSLLPALFFVSALSTGTMVLFLFLATSGQLSELGTVEQVAQLVRVDLVLMLIECFVIFSYLKKGSMTPAKASVKNILRGKLAPSFWLGVVVAGLFIPSLVDIIDITFYSGSESLAAILASVPGLFGGFMLRWVVVKAGMKVPINVGGLPMPVEPTIESDRMRW